MQLKLILCFYFFTLGLLNSNPIWMQSKSKTVSSILFNTRLHSSISLSWESAHTLIGKLKAFKQTMQTAGTTNGQEFRPNWVWPPTNTMCESAKKQQRQKIEKRKTKSCSCCWCCCCCCSDSCCCCWHCQFKRKCNWNLQWIFKQTHKHTHSRTARQQEQKE